MTSRKKTNKKEPQSLPIYLSVSNKHSSAFNVVLFDNDDRKTSVNPSFIEIKSHNHLSYNKLLAFIESSKLKVTNIQIRGYHRDSVTISLKQLFVNGFAVAHKIEAELYSVDGYDKSKFCDVDFTLSLGTEIELEIDGWSEVELFFYYEELR